MCHNFSFFKRDFIKVRDLGFVPSSRSGSTGVGKTFEDFIGVVENNRKDPDLYGFEIKSQRSYSGSYITLFTKSPIFPVKANQYIRDKYGYSDVRYPDLKVIHTSIFHDKICNNSRSGFNFKLHVNIKEQRLYIFVYDLNKNLLDKSIYYSFESIENALNKIKNLAYVSATTKIGEDFKEYFHFTKAVVFSRMRSFDYFIRQIILGNIMYDVRIGSYKTGRRKGALHDHGSGFRIKKELLKTLYDVYFEI